MGMLAGIAEALEGALPVVARIRHYDRRNEIFSAQSGAVSSGGGPQVIFGHITPGALHAWRRSWRDHPRRRVTWDWEAIHKKYRKRYARLEAAIHCEGELCGLAIGTFSPARTILSINWIEGSPEESHPLRGLILDLVEELAVVTATAYGCRLLRFADPQPPVVERFAGTVYRLVASERDPPYSYLERSVP